MLHSNPAQRSNEVPEAIFCTMRIPCAQAITALAVNVIWKSKNNICPPLYFTDWYMEWSPKFDRTLLELRGNSQYRWNTSQGRWVWGNTFMNNFMEGLLWVRHVSNTIDTG